MSDLEQFSGDNVSTALMPQKRLDDAAVLAATSEKYYNSLFGELVNPKARAFLAAYSVLGVKVAAARAADVGINMHQYWLNGRDDIPPMPGYAEAFESAREMAGGLLKREALRRAVEGVRRPIVSRGAVVDYEWVYSDRLMERLLEATLPDEFIRRSVNQTQLTGAGGGPLQVQSHVVVQQLSDDDLARIASAAAPAGLLPGALPLLSDDAEAE